MCTISAVWSSWGPSLLNWGPFRNHWIQGHCLGVSGQGEAQKEEEVYQLSPQGSQRSRICSGWVHRRIQQVAQPAAPEDKVLQDLSLRWATTQWLHVYWFHKLQCPKYISHMILSQCLLNVGITFNAGNLKMLNVQIMMQLYVLLNIWSPTWQCSESKTLQNSIPIG